MNKKEAFCVRTYFLKSYKLSVINTHLGLDKKERETQISEILDYIYMI